MKLANQIQTELNLIEEDRQTNEATIPVEPNTPTAGVTPGEQSQSDPLIIS